MVTNLALQDQSTLWVFSFLILFPALYFLVLLEFSLGQIPLMYYVFHNVQFWQDQQFLQQHFALLSISDQPMYFSDSREVIPNQIELRIMFVQFFDILFHANPFEINRYKLFSYRLIKFGGHGVGPET